MKKIPRVLSMVIVVGMIAAIPASTQILSGSVGESSDGANLPLLILVNRLELSEEQMEALQGLLTNLLEEKETADALRAEFEDVMIRFNGTGEELDELLVTFREDQQALAAALHESVEASLDEVRDLLSINQGIVLREALPELLGGGAFLGSDRGIDRFQNTPDMMGNRILVQPMGRTGMMEQMQQSARGGRAGTPSPMQGRFVASERSGAHPQNAPDMMDNRMPVQPMGRADMIEQMQQAPRGLRGPTQSEMSMDDRNEPFDQESHRFGQDIDNVDPDAMMEQQGNRFGHEQSDDHQVSEERCGHSDEHGDETDGHDCGEVDGHHGEHVDRYLGKSVDHSDNRTGNDMPVRGGHGQLTFGGRGQFGGSSNPAQRLQLPQGEQLAERGDLFELLAQIAEVLQLKLGAVEQ